MWKQRQGRNATYGELIAAFESVGCQAYADFVKTLANNIEISTSDVSDDSCHRSPSISPVVSDSPETCVSLFLSNMFDDNQGKEEGKTIKL